MLILQFMKFAALSQKMYKIEYLHPYLEQCIKSSKGVYLSSKSGKFLPRASTKAV